MRLYRNIANKSSRDNFIFASVTALSARLIGATTVEALVSGHPRGEKKCPYLELAAYENMKINSLYGSLIKRGFDGVTVS